MKKLSSPLDENIIVRWLHLHCFIHMFRVFRSKDASNAPFPHRRCIFIATLRDVPTHPSTLQLQEHQAQPAEEPLLHLQVGDHRGLPGNSHLRLPQPTRPSAHPILPHWHARLRTQEDASQYQFTLRRTICSTTATKIGLRRTLKALIQWTGYQGREHPLQKISREVFEDGSWVHG